MAGRALVGLGAVVFLSLGAWLPGLGGAEANRQDEVQDLVFLGETPLRIRLRILVSGQGFRARQRSTWDDYVRALFRHLDGDGNGRLTEAEARRMPPPPRLRSLAGLNTPVRVAFNFLAIDDNGDGTLTPRELADFYQDYGEGAFQVRPHQTNPASGQLLGQRLFARLDRDSNGKVDRKELQAAARLLADLDGDGDEMLSAAELLGAGVPAAQPGQPANTVLPQPDVPFLSLTPDTQGDLVQRLLDRYGKARPSQRVSVAELGLDPARFALLDGDRNGQLDAAELRRLFALPPDLEVVIRLGKTRKGSPTWEVVHAGTKSPLARHFQRTPTGDLLFELGNTRVRWRIRPALPRALPDSEGQIQQEFRVADRRNQGFLTFRDAQRTDFFPSLFPLLDQNGDGKLTSRELKDYLEGVHRPQVLAVGNVVALEVSSASAGLFDLLDRNRDGRLGLRELRSAAELLDRPGQPPRDFLASRSLPQSYQLSLGLGLGNLTGFEYLPVPGMPLLTLSWSQAGMIWFHKMDRNRDGDLSPAEFLGTGAQFRTLDVDHDGLLSEQEGARAQALFPKKD